MKVGIITVPNQKGQIVIPKDVRDKLHISENTPLNLVVRDYGIYLYPVEGVTTKVETENSYVELLKKTQGAWGQETNDEAEKQTKRRKIEIQAVKDNKKVW